MVHLEKNRTRYGEYDLFRRLGRVLSRWVLAVWLQHLPTHYNFGRLVID